MFSFPLRKLHLCIDNVSQEKLEQVVLRLLATSTHLDEEQIREAQLAGMQTVPDGPMTASHELDVHALLTLPTLRFFVHVFKVTLGQHIKLAKLNVTHQMILDEVLLVRRALEELVVEPAVFNVYIRNNNLGQVLHCVGCKGHELDVVLLVR